ncbi:MAG: hypothetical protein J6T99_06125 [Oscillospiraceae bacterium]|nr:hypothetical protein [Oscillospiraceae bacterium]
MPDFLTIATKQIKGGVTEIYPKFIVNRHSTDLMIRGGDFYAVWMPERDMWSTDEQDALYLIDKELDDYAKTYREQTEGGVRVLHMWDADSGVIDRWHKYCQRQMRDNFHTLDETLIFSNTASGKKDYASKRLSYPLENGPTDSWDRLMSVLYSPEERRKIEWAIGSIVAGDSKTIQKFVVLYGAAGTGKSTVLNVIGQLFEGYTAVFDAKALGSSSNSFALEAFRSNPLVAIQHDGDLSHIEDNTRLNSLVSHELMTVNEKFKSTYANRFKAFLFMGTNKPVRITDAKSGLLRRLIDVSPTGERLSGREYKQVMGRIPFELGAIAWHCRDIYLSAPDLYDDYVPRSMMGASNDFYNFMLDSYLVFSRENETTLKSAWEMYKTYCEDAKVPYPYSQRPFKEELKNYFQEYHERVSLEDGTRVRSLYVGFRADRFEDTDRAEVMSPSEKPGAEYLLKLSDPPKKGSILDILLADCPAQYASEKGTPQKRWSDVSTTLRDIDTHELHYVKVPENHIVIDFDIQDHDGHKLLEENLQEASKWPPTYAELSKSGSGVHLHYIYEGDVSKLSSVFAPNIEVKVFKGNSSLRRMLTKCNNIPVATIRSGLPEKEAKKIVQEEQIRSEKGLRNLILRNIRKEILPGTKPSIDFIAKILNDANEQGLVYDISDMKPTLVSFAAHSTHHADECLKMVAKMPFRSKAEQANKDAEEELLIFFDVEVFPNLFVVCWKTDGSDTVTSMINPSPVDISALVKHRLVGFNNRRYDNHILYGRLMGYSEEQLYKLSQNIVSNAPNCFFREAYNLSYTDIYDFSSKKQSLKKFEIELGIHHQELGMPWDQPVPEDRWEEVAQYCKNDVIATEAVFHARKADWTARQILADVAGLTVNDTTNQLTTKIIFGSDRKPQSEFEYRNLGDTANATKIPAFTTDDYTVFDSKTGRPIFPGYNFEKGVSTYREEEVGEGGYVYAEPGAYKNVALLDIASMHPSSIVAENLFGKYTQNFKDILDARIAIKHGDFEHAKKMLGGKLAPYLEDESMAKDLSGALKIAINATYGQTAAGYENPFRDPRNVDNIVAKRGALFMVNLKHQVQEAGFTVAHIKTDSIKIPDATPEIISFVKEYGKLYGYNFEHEATYERMCLVNDAVYIARYSTVEHVKYLYGEEYVDSEKDVCKENKKHGGQWTATGTQFQVPYVFKTLFSGEKIGFDDLCETKSVSTALYLDFNEGLPEGEHDYRFVGRVGQFCPVKEGKGGGLLLRQSVDKNTGETGYSSATGAKGWRWMESETLRSAIPEDGNLSNILNVIDISYYRRLVDDAVDTIAKYEDPEVFRTEEEVVPPWKK